MTRIAGFASADHALLVAVSAMRCSIRAPRLSLALSWQTHATTRRHLATATPPSTAPRPTYTSPTTGKEYEAVVGLEIHAQLNARTKLFSDSPATVEGSPNTFVSVFDAAIPGALPRLNAKCVKEAIRTAIALNADINRSSTFDRKHYFYQDIPLGYQITQKYAPLATGGFINLLPNHDGLPYPLSVPLVQLQIEQDTARSLVLSSPTFTNFRHYALVGIDLNRAGVGLVEIVTQPSMRSGVEAASFVRKLVATLEHIGSVRTGGMEGGVFRVDVNVSVVPLGADPLSGTRVEVKNLNSIRSVSRAVDHEALRHITLLESNPSQLVKETRHWDELKDITVSNRAKEEKEDYRYMPDGDLPVLKVSEDLISELRSGMPQLPDQIRESLIERHGPNGLAAEVAVKLLNEPGAASYFESLVNDIYARRQQLGNNDKSVKDPANWLVQTLFGVLHGVGLTVETAGFRGLGAEVVGEVVHLAETGRVSQLSAKYILQDIANGDTRPPLEIASSKQLLQDSSESSLLPLVQQVVGSNPEKAEQVKSGKTGLVGWFVGEIRRKSEGKQADPVVLKKLVERELGLGDKA